MASPPPPWRRPCTSELTQSRQSCHGSETVFLTDLVHAGVADVDHLGVTEALVTRHH